MKYFIILPLLFVLGSCSSSSMPPAVNSWQFPTSFKKITVSFHSLPEKWSRTSSSWELGNGTSRSDSGSNDLDDNWSFIFNDTDFSSSGDTLRGKTMRNFPAEGSGVGGVINDLTLAAGKDSICYLSLSYDSLLHGGERIEISDWLIVDNVPYHIDSLNRITISLSGSDVKAAISQLGYSYSDQATYSSHGFSNWNSNTYIPSYENNAFLIITFFQ